MVPSAEGRRTTAAPKHRPLDKPQSNRVPESHQTPTRRLKKVIRSWFLPRKDVEPWTRRSPRHSPVEKSWVNLYDSLQAMAFHVYILRCSDRSYYTGHTDRLETRLMAHERGESKGYTQNRLPVHLVFAEEMPSRQDAIAREQQIKGWSRAKKKP